VRLTKSNLRLAVIGDPIAHSLSPIMHTVALKAAGLEGSYEAIHVPAAQLATVVRQLKNEGYTGFNVTIPHKEAMLEYVDHCDELVTRVGALNTVVRRGDEFVGYNTDVTGFRRILERFLFRVSGRDRDLSSPQHPAFKTRTAIVLGAGGAARAVVAAIAEYFGRIVVANRSLERAQRAFWRFWEESSSLQRREGTHAVMRANESRTVITIIPLTAADLAPLLSEASLLVNATSVGMDAPNQSPLPMGVSLPAHITVCDLVYSPLDTALLRQARAADCQTIDGLQLLVAQGADAFELWTGVRPDERVMHKALSAFLGL
jgi:shikimate dehydrogenase